MATRSNFTLAQASFVPRQHAFLLGVDNISRHRHTSDSTHTHANKQLLLAQTHTHVFLVNVLVNHKTLYTSTHTQQLLFCPPSSSVHAGSQEAHTHTDAHTTHNIPFPLPLQTSLVVSPPARLLSTYLLHIHKQIHTHTPQHTTHQHSTDTHAATVYHCIVILHPHQPFPPSHDSLPLRWRSSPSWPPPLGRRPLTTSPQCLLPPTPRRNRPPCPPPRPSRDTGVNL